MKTTIEEIKDQLQAMLDATEDKPTIERIGTMNSLVDKLSEENTHILEEQKTLLKDYKELVKHTSFKPNGTETEVPDTKEPVTFDSFFNNYKKPENNNN